MKWKQKTATIPIETAPNTVPTEEEECVEQERFEFWHRFCENKTAVFGLVVLVLIILMAVFANFITDPANVTFQDMNARSLSPSLEHPFGTDGFGRDIFARIIYGARSSLFIAFATIAISCLAGLIFGVSCGYFGGRFDTIVMRIVDVFMCLPPLLFSLSIVAALGNGMGNLILAVSITMTPFFTRVIRATVMSVMSMDYIEAARAAGASPSAHHPAPCDSQLHGTNHRGGHHQPVHDDHAGGQPQLYRHGCAAAVSGVGRHALGCPGVHARLALDGAGAGPCHHDHLPGLQPAGRRCARRTGPAHEEVRRSA